MPRAKYKFSGRTVFTVSLPRGKFSPLSTVSCATGMIYCIYMQ